MRLASLILGLFIGIISLFQSCTASIAGNILHDKAFSSEAGAGMVLSFCAIIGAALAMHYPKVASLLFALGAAIGVYFGRDAIHFKDLLFWGFALLLPTAFASLAGHKTKGQGV